MKSLGIVPNEVTYTQIIACYGRLGDVEKVEELLKEVTYNNFSVTKQMYNGLLMAYSKWKDTLNAEKVLREMNEIGLEPDGVNFTNLIVAYWKENNIDKCWKLFEECDL